MEFKCMAVVDGVPREVTLSNPSSVYFELQKQMDIEDIMYWVENIVDDDSIDVYKELNAKFSKDVQSLAKTYRRRIDSGAEEYIHNDLVAFVAVNFRLKN